MIVHPISSFELPWICVGTSSSGCFLARNWNRMIATVPHHEHADDAGDDEDRDLEVVDLLGLRAFGIEDVLRGAPVGTSDEHEGEKAKGHECAEPKHALSPHDARR